MKMNQRGQGLTEYAILLSVVAVASIAVTALFGAALKSKIASLGAAIAGRSSSEVATFERQAQQKSDEAKKAAEFVDGMEIGERELSPAAGGRRAGR
jgi:Flp pilus assembly pilin Flp